MTYSSDKVVFYSPNSNPPVVWTDGLIYPPLQDASAFSNQILVDLATLFNQSGKARSLLNMETSGSSLLRIAGLSLSDSYQIGPAAARADGSPNESLQLNYDESDDTFFFNSTGSLVQGSRLLIIAHELSHLVESSKDPEHAGGGQPTDVDQNMANWDYKGGAVRTQNTVATQLGLSDQVRASYGAFDYHGSFPQLVHNYSYTGGRTIDNVRYGDASNNNQDHSARTDSSRDLFFGFDGSDIMKGAGGDDWLYGGFGIDTLEGGDGDDSLYGEPDNDIFKAGRGADYLHGGISGAVTSQPSALETDGVDTADYSADTSDGIAIRINDQDMNALLAVRTDAVFGTWVTNQQRAGDVDLLISIETIKATAADDVLVVTKLDPLRLAGADGTGGLATVNLAGQSKGDLIDLSRVTSAMMVDLYSGSLYAKDTPALKLTVQGAEIVLGTSQGDELSGGLAADILAGAGGNDFLYGSDGADILFSGTYANDGSGERDRLSGGRGADQLVIQPGSLAVAEGGAAGDKFWLPLDTSGVRQVEITDSGSGDTIYWHGYQLTGGAATHVEIETNWESAWFGYTDSNGIIYYWASNNPSQLVIALPDNTSVIDNDWHQGELGITLTGQVFAQSTGGYDLYPTVAYSNICYDGQRGDFQNLTGRQNALANAGPNVEPVAPTPYAPPAASPIEGAFQADREPSFGALHTLINPLDHISPLYHLA